MNSTAQMEPKVVLLDEAGYYFGSQDDSIKAELRNIEGVPNATYVVNEGKVFVFDKLVQLVNAQRKLNTDQPLADLALSLLVEASVCAKEAVESWGIVPEPYELAKTACDGWMIRHRPFNARLPDTYNSKSEVENAFASILLGCTQQGNGDFSYKGQPMTLCDSLDPALLPPRPVIRPTENPDRFVYTALGRVAYESGFEPVTELLFNQVKELESSWKNDSASAVRYAQAHVADLWARASTLGLELLDEPYSEVPDYGKEDCAELRPLYPELSMLSDWALYSWFDMYQFDSCQITCWTASRDDGFLFYLLGKVVGRQYKRDNVENVGQWVAHSLLRGDSLDAAIAFGQASFLYDSAIASLARRIADAMRFLATDKNQVGQRGRNVTTMMDIFRGGRIFNAKVGDDQNAASA